MHGKKVKQDLSNLHTSLEVGGEQSMYITVSENIERNMEPISNMNIPKKCFEKNCKKKRLDQGQN